MVDLIAPIEELSVHNLAAGIEAARFPVRPREPFGLGDVVFLLDVAAPGDDDDREDETDASRGTGRPRPTPGRGLGKRVGQG